MKRELIQALFNGKRNFAKATAEDMKIPANIKTYENLMALEKEYLSFMETVNDPKKSEALEEKMKVSEALDIIAEVLTIFTQLPIPDKRDPKEYRNAFECVVKALQEKEKEK